MKPMLAAAASVAAPTIGPAVITVFGINIPPLALALSVAGLLLARYIAPPPLRKLTRWQEWALTALLVIILFLIVTGELGISDQPLRAGFAVIWGVGLGFSGLLVVEFFRDWVLGTLKAVFRIKQ